MLGNTRRFTAVWLTLCVLSCLLCPGFGVVGVLVLVPELLVLFAALGLSRLDQRVDQRRRAAIGLGLLLLVVAVWLTPLTFPFLLGVVACATVVAIGEKRQPDPCPVCGREARWAVTEVGGVREGSQRPRLRAVYVCTEQGHRSWRWADEGGALRLFDRPPAEQGSEAVEAPGAGVHAEQGVGAGGAAGA